MHLFLCVPWAYNIIVVNVCIAFTNIRIIVTFCKKLLLLFLYIHACLLFAPQYYTLRARMRRRVDAIARATPSDARALADIGCDDFFRDQERYRYWRGKKCFF